MNTTYLGPTGSQMGKKESIEDTAKVLARMYDGIEYRGFSQSIVEELKKTQASLLKYVNYTMEKLPDESVLKTMPGTQVFLRILLGLSGIKRKGGKPIEESIKNNSQLYKKHLNLIGIDGGGLLALLTFYTVNSYGYVYGLHPQNIVPDKEIYDEVESKKWSKLDSVRAKYEKH